MKECVNEDAPKTITVLLLHNTLQLYRECVPKPGSKRLPPKQDQDLKKRESRPEQEQEQVDLQNQYGRLRCRKTLPLSCRSYYSTPHFSNMMNIVTPITTKRVADIGIDSLIAKRPRIDLYPREQDIIFYGDAKLTCMHPGNVSFADVVKRYLKPCEKSEDKASISMGIVEGLASHLPPVRFLFRSKNSKDWSHLSKSDAVLITNHALAAASRQQIKMATEKQRKKDLLVSTYGETSWQAIFYSVTMNSDDAECENATIDVTDTNKPCGAQDTSSGSNQEPVRAGCTESNPIFSDEDLHEAVLKIVPLPVTQTEPNVDLDLSAAELEHILSVTQTEPNRVLDLSATEPNVVLDLSATELEHFVSVLQCDEDLFGASAEIECETTNYIYSVFA